MLPPASVKLAVALRPTVATSLSSMPVVTLALVPLTIKFSKLPPVAVSMSTVKFSDPSARTSSSTAMLKLALV